MLRYGGDRVTATQMAKLIVGDKMELATDFWHDDALVEIDELTEREKAQVQAALEKQVDRVYKLLGYWELREQIFADD